MYMAIGCQKHAKTESYREYLVYLQGCNEQFIEAPGIGGMVMLVFTLPGFDRVFKVIKAGRAPQRDVCRSRSSCYRLVKAYDRVSRWLSQEFENFVLEKRHISPALMELLLQEAAKKSPISANKL
ncbi:isocitrate dehydrogenase kinase/phosphatase-domain containing protein [Escherichia coli]